MKLVRCVILLSIAICSCVAMAQVARSDAGYVLGPEDAISVHVLDLPEVDNTGAIHIDQEGNVRLPLVGRIHVSGLRVDQVEKEIKGRLSQIMNSPEVTVSVAEFRSHPVSVLGSVRNPGVYQVTGQKALYEVLSLAGGLNEAASNHVKVTRPVAAGRLPLADCVLDPSGKFYVGEVDVRDVMDAKNPDENIAVLAGDVITVPKADLVYVVGAVRRPGGFPLAEKETISVLQAVSLAEGLDHAAGAKKARILREAEPGAERKEIVVNVEEILDGHAKDISLRSNDILFIPTSLAKNASVKALETAIQLGTGLAIWGR